MTAYTSVINSQATTA